MDDIRNILANSDIEPSPDCWNKLSSQLDVLLPQQPTTTSSAQSPTTSAVGKGALHTIWSTGAKIATAVIGTTAIVSAVTFAVIQHNESKETPATEITTQPVTETENIYSENTVPYSENVITEHVVSEESSETNIIAEVSTETPKATTAPQVAIPNPTTPTTIATQQTINTRPSIPPTTPKPVISTTAPKPIQQSVQNDPVLQMHADEEIDMTPPIKLEIPNVFTPNGDGINDCFVIKGIENCSKRQLIVRNHSGQIVFRSSFYNNLWDGAGCPDGVYNYQLFYISNGINQTITGTLHIIR